MIKDSLKELSKLEKTFKKRKELKEINQYYLNKFLNLKSIYQFVI